MKADAFGHRFFFGQKSVTRKVWSVMNFRTAILLITSTFCIATGALAQTVIEDQGVGMSLEELEVLVNHWTPNMQQAAANDPGDRIELLNMALANKKLAEAGKKLTPEENPDRYWQNRIIVNNLERKLFVDGYMADLQIPDMSALALERYKAAPAKYALSPQARKSSHILIKCTAPDCDREAREKLANQVLAELESGASFEVLAEKYSDDPGSKTKGGRFDRWLQLDSDKVDPHYLQGVFAIENIGDHSGLVTSVFGFHIIRLDELKEESYLPFAEVEQAIIDELTLEYRKLAAKELDARYRLTDKAYIDQAAMDKLFSQYKDVEAPAQ
jgi:hypothetical protein